MSTTYTGPTPWDAEEEALVRTADEKPHHYRTSLVSAEMAATKQVRAKQEGYRRAMQDCAPLLEVAKTVASWPHKDGECIIVDKARAAIAQHEGGDQPASSHP